MISENPSVSSTSRDLFRWWLLLLLPKLLIGYWLPLSLDEAYYWAWSQRPALSYFDHPGMVSWLFYLGHFLEPFGQAVRWPAILLGHLGVLFWGLLLRAELSDVDLKLAGTLYFLCPLTLFSGILLTPDLPLMFFWPLALWAFWRSLKSTSLVYPAVCGLALGLGFCSKYHIVLLPLSLAPLLVRPELRARWRPAAWAAVVVTGLAGSLPVLLWNYAHDFVSIRFQLEHGFQDRQWNFRSPLDYFFGELLVIFPTVWWAARKRPRGDLENILYLVAWGPFVFFLLTSLRASTELNWLVMAYPAFFALAAPRLGNFGRRLAEGFWAATLAVLFVAVVFPERFPLHGQISEPLVYRELRDLPRQYSPLYAGTYQMAASLWYESKMPVFKLASMSRFDVFDFWPESRAPDRNFFLLLNSDQGLPRELSARGWTTRPVAEPAPGLHLVEVIHP